MKEYPVYLRDERVGNATVLRQGLYCRVYCRCRFNGEGFFRLCMTDGMQHKDLGILVPDGDSFVVDTSIKAMALQDQHLSFRIVQPGKERVFIPIVEGEDFLHLDKLRKASFENRNGVCGVMIPADP